MKEDILGEYPFNIEERFDEIIIHLQSKENPLGGTVLNLRFRIRDRDKRDRIKEIIHELSLIDT